MNDITIGQRYMSEGEPEFGLGIITEHDSKTLTVEFPGRNETRKYGIKTAPLRRVIFKKGDSITCTQGIKYTVDNVIDEENIKIYICDQNKVSEVELSGAISFSAPEEKLFIGRPDNHKMFNLRYDAFKSQSNIMKSPARGLIGPKVSLIPHQYYIANEVSGRFIPRVLLADEVGLGKTIEAGLILHKLIAVGKVQRAIIVVPDSLVYQWFFEMRRKFQLSFSVLSKESDADDFDNIFIDNDLVITGIGLLKDSELLKRQLLECEWDQVVVDEAHQLKWSSNGPSEEYEIVEDLTLRSKGVLLLTATPEQLGLEGHFARLRLLDPDKFHDFESFKVESETYIKFASIASKISLGDQLTNLELKQISSCIDDNQFDALLSGNYDEDKKESILRNLVDSYGPGRILFRNTRKAMSKRFHFFPKRISCPCELEISKELDVNDRNNIILRKLDWLCDLYSSNSTDKFLLICKSKGIVEYLENTLKERIPNIRIGVFHSDLSLMARDRQAAYFADPVGANILLCTEIGSEGRNFEFAHNMVLFDLPDNPDLLEQRIGRLDRIGQKNDIKIHTPYIKDSREEVLFRWYNEALNSFQSSSKGNMEVFRQLSDDLEVIKNEYNGYEDNGHLDLFLSKAKAIKDKVEKRIEDGRDLLIEMNSFQKKSSDKILNEVEDIDDSFELQNFMENVFDCFGISSEELDEGILMIRPCDNMYVPSFPALPQSGFSATYDRSKALEREELDFITWDHPIAVGALDLILGNDFGNATVAAWKNTKTSKAIFELIFVVKPIAPKGIEVEKYLPPTLVRVLIDTKGVDFTSKYTKEELDERIRPVTSEKLQKLKALPKDLVKKVIEKGSEIARSNGEEVKKVSIDEIEDNFSSEILRLKSLMNKNPMIDEEDIEDYLIIKNVLQKYVREAEISLDSLRLIF